VPQWGPAWPPAAPARSRRIGRPPR
jgi:hypothetical protein